jgi:hypothetical protein
MIAAPALAAHGVPEGRVEKLYAAGLVAGDPRTTMADASTIIVTTAANPTTDASGGYGRVGT